MKLIVAGSRKGVSLVQVAMELDRLKDTLPITEVVSGAAKGVDSFGETWAKNNGIPVRLFPAVWERPGGSTDRGAGFKRNAQMAGYGEALAAFWDGKSPGTKHMIETAAGKGLPTFLFVGGKVSQYN